MKGKIKGNLTVRMVLVIFSLIVITVTCTVGAALVMLKLGELKISGRRFNPMALMLLIFAISILVGTLLACFVSSYFLRPIKALTQATKKVAKGNFDVNIDYDNDNEVGELISNFNVMVEDLKKIDTLTGDFIANVSHEFKTPLSAIQGYSTLLQDETLTKEERDGYISSILAATRQLGTLVTNILQLSKLDVENVDIKRQRFNLDEQIRQAILQLEPQWGGKNIEFDIGLDLGDITITANEQLTMHIWLNLIGNAIKFSESGGRIEVSSSLEGEFAAVRVRDYGIGMDEETKSHIFDRFYQGDDSRGGEGNGLGLALVKKVCEVSGFEISVMSERNKGTGFLVKLPLYSPQT